MLVILLLSLMRELTIISKALAIVNEVSAQLFWRLLFKPVQEVASISEKTFAIFLVVSAQNLCSLYTAVAELAGRTKCAFVAKPTGLLRNHACQGETGF